MSPVDRVAVVSGYFNPAHIGHLRMFQAAKEIAPHLLVLVNNDRQQLLKKGQIIIPEHERLELVAEFRCVDEAILTVDEDATVIRSLHVVRDLHPDADIIFCNGGDRSSADSLPPAEAETCAELRIEMRYGVGGSEKQDSSTRINALR
jgi:cytidyltransferase-like protein